jgi:hypothetical protein
MYSRTSISRDCSLSILIFVVFMAKNPSFKYSGANCILDCPSIHFCSSQIVTQHNRKNIYFVSYKCLPMFWRKLPLSEQMIKAAVSSETLVRTHKVTLCYN